MTLALIDPPSPFDNLATWQRHLVDVRRRPDDAVLKSEMLRTAEEAVAPRRHPQPIPMTWCSSRN